MSTSSSSSSSSSYSSTSSTSPSHHPSFEKRHWWLTTKKIVEKYIREARLMISTRDQTEINSALSLLDSALTLSPSHELGLELKARCLLYLRRYRHVADMLQEYIPSYKMAADSGDSSGSSSDNSSKERVKLLGSDGNSVGDSVKNDYDRSVRCFNVSDLKKRVLCGFYKNFAKEGQWRYLVLGQACCHLGLMEDAMVLLQHGKRLASAAFRRESICWSDDSFSFAIDSDNVSSSEPGFSHHQPLTEGESISHLIVHIKVLLRRRAAALAALDAGLFAESVRHFSKILEGRRAAPQAFLAECYLLRSAAYKSAGRVAESIADLNRTLALDPNSTEALQIRAELYEMIGCIADAVHDLEHVKLLFNSILRDRKPPGPAWKPRSVPYREIPGRLVTLGLKMSNLKQRIAMGETGKNVDYYALIGLRKGCSRSELDRAHLLLVLKHKPEKSISFIDRCEFSDVNEFDSVKDRARMSAVLLYRLIQRGYTSLLATIAQDEANEKERKTAEVEKQRVQVNKVAPKPSLEPNPEHKAKVKVNSTTLEPNIEHKANVNSTTLEPNLEHKAKAKVKVNSTTLEPNLEHKANVNSNVSDNNVGSFPFQGVFCRDLAVVGSLLSQAGFNRPISVKFEALSC